VPHHLTRTWGGASSQQSARALAAWPDLRHVDDRGALPPSPAPALRPVGGGSRSSGGRGLCPRKLVCRAVPQVDVCLDMQAAGKTCLPRTSSVAVGTQESVVRARKVREASAHVGDERLVGRRVAILGGVHTYNVRASTTKG
jgi:hypothetical protein